MTVRMQISKVPLTEDRKSKHAARINENSYHCRKYWRSVLRLPTDHDGRCPRIQMTAFAFIAAFSIDRAEWKKEIGVWAQPLRGKGYDSAPSSSLPFQSSSIRRGLHSHKMQRKKQETPSHTVYVVSFAAGHSKTLTSSADDRFMAVSQNPTVFVR